MSARRVAGEAPSGGKLGALGRKGLGYVLFREPRFFSVPKEGVIWIGGLVGSGFGVLTIIEADKEPFWNSTFFW